MQKGECVVGGGTSASFPLEPETEHLELTRQVVSVQNGPSPRPIVRYYDILTLFTATTCIFWSFQQVLFSLLLRENRALFMNYHV